MCYKYINFQKGLVVTILNQMFSTNPNVYKKWNTDVTNHLFRLLILIAKLKKKIFYSINHIFTKSKQRSNSINQSHKNKDATPQI